MMEALLVFLIFGSSGGLLVVMNGVLGPRKTNINKEKPFECGSPYLQEGINPVPVKYPLVAFLFLLFDIEIMFFPPLALVFKKTEKPATIIILTFLFILFAGFIYAWKKGSFDWNFI